MVRLRPSSKSALMMCSVLLGMTGVSGCADDNVSLFVRGPVPPMASMGSCTFDPSGDLQFDGTFDVGSTFPRRTGYKLGLAVQNQLQARATSGRAEPNGIHITRAEIRLEDIGGNLILPAYSVPTAGYVPPGADATNPGQGIVTVEVIPVSVIPALAGVGDGATVVSYIRLFGETNGTIDIETGDYVWPISLCNGCLFLCLDDPDASQELACIPGQDSVSLIQCAM